MNIDPREMRKQHFQVQLHNLEKKHGENTQGIDITKTMVNPIPRPAFIKDTPLVHFVR